MSTATNPVVSDYLRTDKDLRMILASVDLNEPILEAMVLLTDFVNGKQSANGAFLAAKAVDIRGLDADLCILFLTTWARACFVQSGVIDEQRSAAWTLTHRARALTSAQSTPEIIASIDTVEADLVGSEGNRTRQQEILRLALDRIPQHSPRRSYALINLARLLSLSGSLAGMNEDSLLLDKATAHHQQHQISLIKFMNAVETGQIRQAQDLIPRLAQAEMNSHSTNQFKRYRTLIELMQDTPAPRLTHADQDAKESDLPDWALVLQCLLSGSIHQALRWARTCERRQSNTRTDNDCTSFNLIRAELAEENFDAARRLMELRHSCGNHHFMDDLFLARISWLTHDENTAIQQFARVLKAADSHKASGRLAFELRLSTELPRDALHSLTRTAHTVRLTPAQAITPEKQVDSAEANLEGIRRLLGSSPETTAIRDTVLQFSTLAVPVLITGETGTGKEVVARAIHESGPRKDLPFLAINCGAISESLLESELFGHEKGAFSGAATAHQGLFEEAGSGTIFLDEIGEISPRLQVVLLRVLETQEVRPVGSSRSKAINCRILASTNANLQALTRIERFRTDLLFRLRRLEIHLPPLRERNTDILELATFFLNEGRSPDAQAMMSQKLMTSLRTYSWPGNVRELRNSIERMRLMNSDKLYYDITDIDIAMSSPADTEIMNPTPHIEIDVSTVRNAETEAPEHSTIKEDLPILQKGRTKVRRLMTLRQLFEKHTILTRAEIIRMLDISPNTATQDLRALCEQNFVRRVQPSASPRSTYFENMR